MTESSLPTQYAPAEVEGKLYERWTSAGLFTADPARDPEAPAYTIVIPPPNVTGSLHMGHALDHSIQDTLVRRRRMQGYEALWLPGMDHAGIATQNVVEKRLRAEGKTRHDLGREAFQAEVWKWKAESGGAILGQMKRLGDSVDWSRERFTMDEGLSRAVLTIFKRLYDDELIYRAERIINWCPRCLTALSDIEVEHAEREGELVSIRYTDEITVATTRAETMLGDTAVAVHPGDERYAHLVGTEIELPLTGRRIPVVADEHVDPEFGTGAVKVTPAHDPNDFEIGRRHDLPSVVVLDEHARVTADGPFKGMERYDARAEVVEALRREGRIVKEVRPYNHAVGHCSRCQTVVEPRVSLQWFVKVAPLAKAAGDAVRDGSVTIEPAELSPRYFAWVDNMHDWCISRQLWWGHRIPVWYGPDGEQACFGPDEEIPEGWTQDGDVLDTWFSSALWPFSTLGWPDQTEDLKRFYPTSVLVTGYDILFFWVARMMMFGLYAMDGVAPFKTIYLHGMVRDQFGKKMSKSFGNVVNPLDWIESYGADATRFTLLRGANPGGDVPVAEEWAQGSRNFCNKLWNATRFALMNGAHVNGPLPSEYSTVDGWILSRLQTVVRDVDRYVESYDFAKAAETLYHFAWDEVCDWYLELSKVPLGAGGAPAEATRRILGEVLDKLLRLLHPMIPFITEELWIALTGQETVVRAPWPVADPAFDDDNAEEIVASLQRLVTEVRRFRSDQGLKPGQRVAAVLEFGGSPLQYHEEAIRSVLRLTTPDGSFSATATFPAEGVTVKLDTSGAIDVAAERARLEKDLAAARKDLAQTTGKLGNADFVAKAPEAVINKNKARQAAAEADITRLEGQLASLPAG
ncbi:valine--tRNA ligase [Actinocorallia lasiicapitis]